MKEHPNIVIKMTNNDNEKLFELMHQHTLDILIIPSINELPKDLKSIPLEKEEYCFAYNKEVLGELEINKLEEIYKQTLLLPVKTTEQRKKIEEVLNNNGITSDPIMELETNETMLNYIKEGMGVGYILKSIAAKNPELQIVELETELPSEIITLVFNETTLTSSSKEFINERYSTKVSCLETLSSKILARLDLPTLPLNLIRL
jgi:DNA-binding transcriptional LysR family regulator